MKEGRAPLPGPRVLLSLPHLPEVAQHSARRTGGGWVLQVGMRPASGGGRLQDSQKQPSRAGTYHLPQLLVGNDNDVWGVPNGGGSPSNVGEDHLCNKDLPWIEVQHLT